MSDNRLNQEHFSEPEVQHDKNDSGAEEYTFIEETICPKKKTRLKKLVFTMVLGVCFGGVACLTFCVCYPMFSDVFNLNEKQIVIKMENPDNISTVKPINTLKPTKSPSAIVTSTPKPTKKTEVEDIKDASITNLISQIQNVQSIVRPALVTVNAVRNGKDILGNPAQEDRYSSGIIVYKDASKVLILTNSDVVDRANYIMVEFSDRSVYKSELYKINRQVGIALLKLKLDKLDENFVSNIAVAKVGDPTALCIGEPVIAVGSPNGYPNSIDYGIISNEQHDAFITDGVVKLFNTTIAHNNNGNGFVLDKKGTILGVITHKENFVSDLNANLNTCLSMASIQPYVDKMISQADNLYLGMLCYDISKEEATKLGISQGVYVIKVEESSPAFEAGVKKGDVLLEMNGVQIYNMSTYNNTLIGLSYKADTTLKINRKQGEEWIPMELGVIVSKTN